MDRTTERTRRAPTGRAPRARSRIGGEDLLSPYFHRLLCSPIPREAPPSRAIRMKIVFHAENARRAGELLLALVPAAARRGAECVRLRRAMAASLKHAVELAGAGFADARGRGGKS